jgi:hypothetical protein
LGITFLPIAISTDLPETVTLKLIEASPVFRSFDVLIKNSEFSIDLFPIIIVNFNWLKILKKKLL